jgi:hypothetical protein
MTKKIEPIAAVETIDCVDVMEAVAHDTNGPEPPPEVAQAWLDKHAEHIANAMHYGARDYIREHWNDKEK